MKLDSPLGPLTLVARDGALAMVSLPGFSALESAHDPVLDEAARQLDAYFAGKRRSFDLPLKASGTDWQKRVWNALCAIPFGETATYGDIARALGQPTATRAVGAANGRNPIPIVVPCHRVIGADGTLTGYGGGLPTKRWLLAHEGAQGTLLA
jgi:methylated-DNA-[protein]-cysteine S-methyltransferase